MEIFQQIPRQAHLGLKLELPTTFDSSAETWQICTIYSDRKRFYLQQVKWCMAKKVILMRGILFEELMCLNLLMD